jgi:hypothetical protein
MRFSTLLLAACLLVQGIDSGSTSVKAEELVNLPTRPGITQRVWLMAPAGPPSASVVLLVGAEGVIGAT